MPKKRFIVTLTLPDRIEKEIQIFRERFDFKNSQKIIPHITLIQPFQIKTSLAEVEKKLVVVARNTSVFEIILKGVGVFLETKKVVYVKVEKNTPLANLQKKLSISLKGLIENSEGRNFFFIPHVTLVSGLTFKRFKKITGELLNLDIVCKLSVNSFSLFEFTEKNFWQIKEEFKFK